MKQLNQDTVMIFSIIHLVRAKSYELIWQYCFTWREIAKLKNSTNTNLLILDEIFDSSLDTSGTDEFMRILYHTMNKENVFVISHKGDTLIDKFPRVMKFEKYKNFTRMAE